jgi:hypothetical protein
MSMAGGASLPTLWTINGVGIFVLCCLLAQGFEFCGALMLVLGNSYDWLSLLGLLRGRKVLTPMHLWGGVMVLRSRRG